MRTLLSRATQVDPSFNVGLGLVVILALAEIFAVTSYYVSRVETCANASAGSRDDDRTPRGSSRLDTGGAGDTDGSFTRNGCPNAPSVSYRSAVAGGYRAA